MVRIMAGTQEESSPAGAHRCRLCTANDEAALTEELAAALWERHRSPGGIDDWPWPEAGDYWQSVFRQLATEAVATLRAERHPTPRPRRR